MDPPSEPRYPSVQDQPSPIFYLSEPLKPQVHWPLPLLSASPEYCSKTTCCLEPWNKPLSRRHRPCIVTCHYLRRDSANVYPEVRSNRPMVVRHQNLWVGTILRSTRYRNSNSSNFISATCTPNCGANSCSRMSLNPLDEY